MTQEPCAADIRRRPGGWPCLQSAAFASSLLLVTLGAAPSHSSLTKDGDVPVAQQPGHEHHHTPSPSYSLFMHHAAGTVLLAIGVLIFADRITAHRYRWIRYAQASAWIAVGIFLFIRADPEGWPMGTIGLMDSFRMPTAGEWAQHKVLSLIPVVLGLQTAFLSSAQPRPGRNYVLAALAILGVVGLLSHQHQNHPGADIVNLQHAGFAATATVIALSLLVETRPGRTRLLKRFLFPSALMVLGAQLALYIE